MEVKKTGKDMWLPSHTYKTPPCTYLGKIKFAEVHGYLFYSVLLFASGFTSHCLPHIRTHRRGDKKEMKHRRTSSTYRQHQMLTLSCRAVTCGRQGGKLPFYLHSGQCTGQKEDPHSMDFSLLQ